MKKTLLTKIFLCSLASFSLVAVVTGVVSWFVSTGAKNDKQADGVIGLRSYFYDGDGETEETAYEITTPTHMYNLSQLQNIGLFRDKKYFQIGHRENSESEYKVITGYDASGDPIWGDELDMTGTIIPPIGNEATPFMGQFRGNGIPVSNAIVQGNPEDIGFFGYVGSIGDITGLVLKNATVESLGYNSTSTNQQYKLFNPEIEDLYFQSTKYFEKFTKVKFYGYDNSAGHRDAGTLLTQANGLGGSSYGNINNNGGNLITVTNDNNEEEYIYNGYFEIKFPKDFLDDPNVSMTSEERAAIQNSEFEFNWVTSTPLIEERECISVDGDNTNDLVPMINLTKLINAPTLEESDFNYPGVNSVVKTRLYLYATIEYKNFVYSRVIQAYSIEFNSNHDQVGGGYSMAMFCDYVGSSDENHTVTNYHHGNNIGFLAGHLDGNMANCYVYGNDNGSTETGSHLIFNNASGMSPIATTSDIGLVGEVGEGVYNKMDPDLGVLKGGDIGVMNFTKIYEGIRRDFNNNEVTKAGHFATYGANYVAYTNAKNTDDDSLFWNYEKYLRYTNVNNVKHYLSGVNYTIPNGSTVDTGDDATLWHNYTITNNLMNSHPEINSVDFLWNSLIEDEENTPRGLGVFKIATVHDDNASNPNGLDMYRSMGGSEIVNGPGYTKVYFSTAEYDHAKNGNTAIAWNGSYPVRGSTIPSYSDIGSFDYNFGRDYNYCFQLDLEQIGDTNGYNYMSNTDSPWLVNYLSSKLIDKKNIPVEPGTKRFGFMFRSSESEELNALSSYMPVGYPKAANKSSYNGRYYPSNSIVFKIDNENGANVSVVARRHDVTIYQHHSDVASSSDIVPVYTMRATKASTDVPSIDAHRYFKFDVKKTVIENGEEVDVYGVTGTEAVPFDNNMLDDDELYAHIFKLPQGEYVIGTSRQYVQGTNDTKQTSDIYYLAVQGQNEGDIGSDTGSTIGNELDAVDFLTAAPTKAQYPDSLAYAKIQFFGQFNTMHGDFEVSLKNVDSANHLSLLFEGPDDPTFVTKFSVTCSDESPHYYIRNEKFTKIYHPYRT